jgi:hypothetical protein
MARALSFAAAAEVNRSLPFAQTSLSLNRASPYFCSSFPLDRRFPSAL